MKVMHLLFSTIILFPSLLFAFSGNGNGTVEAPYQITTVQQLQEMNENLDAYYRLMNDIDASETKLWNDGKGFLPIGDEEKPFTGSLNGANNTIFNLTIHRANESNIGLIGVGAKSKHKSDGCTLDSITVKDVDIIGFSSVGALIGKATSSIIEHCNSSGKVKGFEDDDSKSDDDWQEGVGGQIGTAFYSSMAYCYSSTTVEGIEKVGGFIGVQVRSRISHCVSSGTVTGLSDYRVGGFIGLNATSHISHSYATGHLLKKGAGFVGYHYSWYSSLGQGFYHPFYITACYSTGKVQNFGFAGGATDYFGQVQMSYWDTQTSGVDTSNATNSGSNSVVKKTFVNRLFGYDSCHIKTIDFKYYSCINGDTSTHWSIDHNRYPYHTFRTENPTVEYLSTANGFISGEVQQNPLLGSNTSPVLAVPHEGYAFYRWSDGRRDNPRYDINIAGDLKISAEFHIPMAGNGSKENPWQISTLKDLQNIQDNPEAHYILVNDIDATETKDWNRGQGFIPIGGRGMSPFSGSINGKGHSICNLFISHPKWSYGNYIGFIAYSEFGRIDSLNLTNIDISGNCRTGGIIGHGHGVEIYNSTVSGNINGNNEVGGIIGCSIYGSLLNCSVSGTLSKYEPHVYEGEVFGGIIGKASSSTIYGCNTNTNIISNKLTGGIVGYADKSNIFNSSSKGTINVDSIGGYSAGGIIGASTNHSKIINCYSLTNIKGSKKIGGVAGSNIDNSTIKNCYATGVIVGDSLLGGLVGYLESKNVVNSFWDIETSGIDSSAAGFGKTTAEMKSAALYLNAGWDFMDESANGTEEIWKIDEGNSYPVFTTRVRYSADSNGTISGDTLQVIDKGGSGTAVTAVPNTNYRFIKWSDGRTDNPRQDTNITGNISVKAEFALVIHKLRYATDGNGTLKGGVLKGLLNQFITHGKNGYPVYLIPDSGYAFSHWSDGRTDNPRQDSAVTKELSVIAVFKKLIYHKLRYATDGNGTLKGGVLKGLLNQLILQGKNGHPVHLIPDYGYTFSHWSDGRTDNPRQDSAVMKELSVIAIFEKLAIHKLRYATDGNGTLKGGVLKGLLNQFIYHGYNGHPVHLIPDSGYVFSHWSDGRTDNPRQDTAVTGELSVIAVFDKGVSILEKGEFESSSFEQKLLAYPNPVPLEKGSIDIIVNCKKAGKILLMIYDNLGNTIEQHESSTLQRAPVKFTWDLRNQDGLLVSSGTYIAIAQLTYDNGDREVVKTMIGIRK